MNNKIQDERYFIADETICDAFLLILKDKDLEKITVTVEKLGNLDEVRTKADGMDPYVWIREYVNELNRREYEDTFSSLSRRMT